MIIRVAHESHFTTISNATLQESKLSACALGMLCYLLSHSKDWQVRRGDIAKRFDTSKRTVSRWLAELRQAGYAHTTATRDEKGRLTGTTCIITELPHMAPRQAQPSCQNTEPRRNGNLRKKDGSAIPVGSAEPVPVAKPKRKKESARKYDFDDFTQETAAESAAWYYEHMQRLGRITAASQNRSATVKRWEQQFLELRRALGASKMKEFGRALSWALSGGDLFWWQGGQGRCDAPSAWLKKIRGEERTRAENLIDKHQYHLARKNDYEQQRRHARRYLPAGQAEVNNNMRILFN